MRVRVHTRGPMFDGRAPRAIHRGGVQTEQDIANAARDQIRRDLIVVPKNPTGYYRSRIVTRRMSGRHVVVDSGVVYGPWLEGVGSRNFPVTRFRGYSLFRKAFRRFSGAAGAIAERVMGQYTRGL